MPRKTINDIQAKTGIEKIICLTAYTAPIARLLDRHVDILLVGDSLGMVLYEYENTLPVTLDQMIEHTKAVMKSTSDSCIIMDLPFGTYEESKEQAFSSALRSIKETNCAGIKLEGGSLIEDTVKHITKRGIPVMGHIGLQPQSIILDGGYKIKGRDKFEWKKYIDDAIALENAGAFAIVLEGMAEQLAVEITNSIKIPTIGIGASAKCDGQILVTEDMLGLTNISPKFVKEYTNLRLPIEKAIKEYVSDVKLEKFPSNQHTYQMKPTIIKKEK
jgi:3-methyl-2-oxobutanoate hydroxymethyltransferase|tara:strand:+ start:4246 stop:5067 length:822 start_codon:yes stop_codon:yes gene_type:complete